MNSKIEKAAFYLVCALFVFLPFSSWLVSLLGNAYVSVIRDLLIVLVFLVVLLSGKIFRTKRTTLLILAVLLLAWGAASYFWREASLLQWLKGYRFTFLPLILFVSLLALNFKEAEKKTIIWIILGGGILVSLLSVIEAFGIKLPLTSSLSTQGALSSIHFVGTAVVMRLQSVLAGPNALGLYLLSVIGFTLVISKKWIRLILFVLFSIILALTFSRSALLGLIIFGFSAFYFFFKEQYGRAGTFLATIIFLFALLFAGYVAYSNPKYTEFFNHNDSTSQRIDQYKRIWDTKSEIGLLGRGPGTAGPSSQYRLDHGANHWTENVYLDIFEEFGLIGLLLYLYFIIALVVTLAKDDSTTSKVALSLLISYSIAGIFINYYTGQVGINLLWLILGLALMKEKNEQTT